LRKRSASDKLVRMMAIKHQGLVDIWNNQKCAPHLIPASEQAHCHNRLSAINGISGANGGPNVLNIRGLGFLSHGGSPAAYSVNVHATIPTKRIRFEWISGSPGNVSYPGNVDYP
jgi:hypothetical protein